MKRSMILTVELSEKRERVNALLGKADLSNEERGEMDAATKRIQEIEPELRASIVAEDGEENSIRMEHGADAEGREMREMLDQANVGKIFEAVVEHRSVGGREDEIQKHFKVGAKSDPASAMLQGSGQRSPGRDHVTDEYWGLAAGDRPASVRRGGHFLAQGGPKSRPGWGGGLPGFNFQPYRRRPSQGLKRGRRNHGHVLYGHSTAFAIASKFLVFKN